MFTKSSNCWGDACDCVPQAIFFFGGGETRPPVPRYNRRPWNRHVPREKAMTRSLSMTLPDWSRNRSGRNCCGCCQSSGSMCALYRFTITCISNSSHLTAAVIPCPEERLGQCWFLYAFCESGARTGQTDRRAHGQTDVRTAA